MRAERIAMPCPTCAGALRRGLLWLRGNDYAVCPSCNGSGTVDAVEQRFVPVERTISIPGVGAITVPRHHPTFERLH